MSRSRKLAIGFAVGLACLAAVVVWRQTGEPRCNGRSLSEWLAVCVEEQGAGVKSDAGLQAEQAIRQIGSNAVPYLLKWMRDGSEPWQVKLDWMLEKVTSSGTSPAATESETVSRRSGFAMMGFAVLGPKAASAAPDLLKLTLSTNFPNLSAAAAEAFGSLGNGGVPLLMRSLGEPVRPRHLLLVDQIHYMRDLGTNAAPLIPLLVADTHDADWVLARAAARDLGALAIEPEQSVRALTNCLEYPHYLVRCQAAQSLARFGSRARMAVPALEKVQGDRSLEVRAAVTNALLQVQEQP